MADDIFEELVILSGKASQDILHRLEALLPIIDLWMEGKRGREKNVRLKTREEKRKRLEESEKRLSGEDK